MLALLLSLFQWRSSTWPAHCPATPIGQLGHLNLPLSLQSKPAGDTERKMRALGQLQTRFPPMRRQVHTDTHRGCSRIRPRQFQARRLSYHCSRSYFYMNFILFDHFISVQSIDLAASHFGKTPSCCKRALVLALCCEHADRVQCTCRVLFTCPHLVSC